MNSPMQDSFQTRLKARKTNQTSYNRENIKVNLLYLYGEEIYKLSKIFEKLHVKRTRLFCDLTFLQRCRDQNIIPICCKLSFHTKTPKIIRILKKSSQALLREIIRQVRFKLEHTSQELLAVHLQLSKIIHPLLWESINNVITFRSETEGLLKTNKQKQKFEKLKRNQAQNKNQKQTPTRIVHNLSNKTLSEAATQVLEKGFNFAITPSRLPIENIICGVETALYNLNEETAEIIRQDVSNIIRKSKPPPRNISRDEHLALKELRSDSDIIILPADKGNATVVMNKTDYEGKLKSLLEDPAYKQIVNDPTTYLEKVTKSKINSTPLEEDIKRQVIPREKSSRCPKFYGLPKIHKSDVPLRPIVSAIDSPTQSLAKYLAKQLQPLAEQIQSYVRDSDHFINIIKEQQLADTDLLVSFDVVSLFTQIPITEAMSIITHKYQPPEHITMLSTHCLTNTYFTYNGLKYKQIEGAPMGSPLSPVIANLFMEDLENKALSTAKHKPTLWVRYVDDTFVIWPHGEQKLSEFLTHLNTIHPKIKFTMELEKHGQLPFLDVLVIKKQNGTLGHTIHRKATHTSRYLNAQSHHHPVQIEGVAKTLIARSTRLADADHRTKETDTIKNALINNGYSLGTINKIINNRNKKNSQKLEHPIGKAFLPYIKGTTDKISKTLRKQNIDTIFTTDRKIGEILPSAKERIALENQGVYEIPCGSCSQSYVGQTNRRISVRCEEHKNAVKNKLPTSSLAQHVITTGHKINFQATRTLCKSKQLRSRIIREAIEIEKRPENLNKRDDTQRLPRAWKPLLKNCRTVHTTESTRQNKEPSPAQIQHETESEYTYRDQNSQRSGPVTRSQARQSIYKTSDTQTRFS